MEYFYKNYNLEDIVYKDESGNIQVEKWVDIPNYARQYQVSNLGRVKSKMFKNNTRDLILKSSISKSGYLRVRLYLNSKPKTIAVHKLVAISFLGVIKKGYCVDHINNISLDNRVCNLQIITIRENSTKDRVNITGYNNVYFKKDSNKFESRIIIDGKLFSLGLYNTAQEAKEKYDVSLFEWLNYNKKPIIRETSSKYIGISFNKKMKAFVVNIMIDRVRYYLGKYSSEKDAKEVYLKARYNYENLGIIPDKYETKHKSSKYKYIVYYKPYGKWLSKYKDVDGNIKHIGYYLTEEEAFAAQQNILQELTK